MTATLYRRLIPCLVALAGLGAGAPAWAPAPVEPMRVCEVLAGLDTWRGKTVAVLGRYSYRTTGRYLSEASCAGAPAALRLVADRDQAPRLPDPFDVDGAATGRKLKLVRQSTTLGKFRFGSLEYDRWAIVYGRVEPAPPPSTSKPAGLEPAAAQLLYRGDGLIFFLASE